MIVCHLRRFALLAALAAVTGCSALSVFEEASTPLAVYDLRAPDDGPVARSGPLARDVTIELPTASGVLQTDRIMIRPDSVQAQYLPGVRWGDEVPVMMQTLMLRALENTGALRYVGRRPLAGQSDFAVVTELVDFHAQAAGEGAVISIRMTTRIVRERDARIIASRTFQTDAQAGSTQTDALIAAFDAATDAALLEFADWVIRSLGGRLS